MAIDRGLNFTIFPHGDDGGDLLTFHCFTNKVRIIASVCDQEAGLGAFGRHQGLEALMIGGLARRDLYGDGKTLAVRPEMNL